MSHSYIPVALREEIAKRANRCCEYCLQPESMSFAVHQADHIISEKHDGETSSDNLALACVLCNQYKGSDIATIDPQTKEITRLFNPRQDNWNQHFQLNTKGVLSSSTVIGRGTIKLLRLNQIERVEERALLIATGLLESFST